jgi:hypothetical protein
MPAPRVFVSSTAYDLGHLRGRLHNFVQELGFEPVLSEFSDVLFDPRDHTHTNCLKEIPGCDLLVVVVGGRFGSDAVAEAVSAVDFEVLAKLFSTDSPPEPNGRYSVTQLEVLKAVELGVPVFAFVDSHVMHDHDTYEANKDSEFSEHITFTSISEQKAARFIFAATRSRNTCNGSGVSCFSGYWRRVETRSEGASEWTASRSNSMT